MTAAGWIYFSHHYIASGGRLQNVQQCIDLQVAGITAVLNLDDLYDNADLCTTHGFAHHWIQGYPDDAEPKPVSYFKEGLDFALPLLHANQRLYVHCAAGASRSPSMVYAILRAYSGYPSADCKDWVYGANNVNGRQIGLTYARSADAALAELGFKDRF